MVSARHTRQLLTGLFDSIPKPTDTSAPGNPLSHLSPAGKETFLTLHVLFPNELLPALDLLDRGLVTRLRITPTPFEQHPGDEQETRGLGDRQARIALQAEAHEPRAASFNHQEPQTLRERPNSQNEAYAYYVRSAQQSSSRSNSRFRNATYEHTTYYEVKLNAWSCSCPAFAFSAFPATAAPPPTPTSRTARALRSDQEVNDWHFGCLSNGDDIPACKHLVACLLVKHTAMFATFVEERLVTVEELAGWAAGWGD